MKLTFKLFATLSEYLPPGAHENAVQIDIPDNASLTWIIDKYHVPRELAHLVLVNGVFACSADRDKTILKEGDTLAIWPPVAGG